ncbi:cytochrome P450 [Trichoderma pleuroticola]
MGFIELFLEKFSITRFFLSTVGVWTAVFIVGRIREHQKIKSLGSYGPALKPLLPLGLDFVYYGARATLRQQTFELWRDVLFSQFWTIEMRVLNERVCFTADPENIKAVLATQFQDFGKGKRFHDEWYDFLGDSIFTIDGAPWHDTRQLLRPQFSRDRVSDLYCFEKHVQMLFKAIANGGPLDGENQPVDLSRADGRRVDVKDLLFRFTLDASADFLLGTDFKSLTNPQHTLMNSFNEVQRIQNIIVRAPLTRLFISKKPFYSGIRDIENFVNPIIQRVLSMTSDQLAAHTKSDRDYTLLHELASFTRDPKLIRDQIFAILLAGRDTTASTLSFAMYELSRHPQVVARLRDEILAAVGTHQLPSYEHLKDMPYLRAVLNETLRLYPPVPFNVRVALKDTTLPRGGGPDGTLPLSVPQNTRVAYSTLVMQRRPDLYPPVSETFADPAVFSPERWAVWHPKPHEFIPFNAGPRFCLGQQFALTEMGYTLCRIFQRFDRVQSFMHEIDGGELRLKTDIVLTPAQGVHVAFWEAKNDQ